MQCVWTSSQKRPLWFDSCKRPLTQSLHFGWSLTGGSTVLSEYQIFASHVVYSLVVKRIEMNCLDIIAVNPTTELPGRSLITLFSTCTCFIFFVNKMMDFLSISWKWERSYCFKYSVPIRLRWLNWTFWGGYLPSLSINYVAMSKDMEKRSPKLYYIKMKNSYDLGFIAIGVAMAT